MTIFLMGLTEKARSFMKTMLAKVALRVLRVVGIVVDDYESEDSCFIGFSKHYEKLSSWQKEILFRIATSASSQHWTIFVGV